jgi:glycosyltransferase involved in cell wall biosynthesis
LYSEPVPAESSKGDSVELPTSIGRKIPRLALGERVLMQLPPLGLLASSDLVIVVQASGYVLNYPLLVLSALRLKRVGFWGHGWNRQGAKSSLSERLKRRLARSPDWWFAYTEKTKQYLVSAGMDPNRVTTIDNAIDTREFSDAVLTVRQDEIAATMARLHLAREHRIALYCGSLYREKRLPFLLEAARQIRSILPGFCLLVIGAGKEEGLVREFAAQHDFVRYLGPLFAREKAVLFRLAEVFLNPGVAGLAILDSFAARMPFITTTDAPHGPEVDYLVHNSNGLFLPSDERAFAREVAQLLADSTRLARLRDGAGRSGARYTIENMVRSVESGILSCLGLSRQEADAEQSL